MLYVVMRCSVIRENPDRTFVVSSQCDASAQAPHNQYASDKYTFSGLIMSYRDEESIQEAIMTAGPVEAAFIVYSDFANYVSM